MSLGKGYANLANTQRRIRYQHGFWWIVWIIVVMVALLCWRWYQQERYDASLSTVEQSFETLEKQGSNYRQQIDQLPKTLPQQRQQKHKKIAIMLRLIQSYLHEDMKLKTIELQDDIRIVGESKEREHISALSTQLLEYGYFAGIVLEQIRQTDQGYSFVLQVSFSEQFNLQILQVNAF